MAEDAAHFRDLARKARELAESLYNEDTRRGLLEFAVDCDRRAADAEAAEGR